MIKTTPQTMTRVETPVLRDNTRVGAIFRHAFRDNLTTILAWGIGYGFLLVLIVMLYPSLQSQGTLSVLMGGLGMLGLMGDFAGLNVLNSFVGYLVIEGLLWAPMVLAVFTMPQALGVIAHEEQRGTLDILLSTPIPRWRFLTEKVLAVIASLFCILFMMWVALVISAALVPEVDLEFSRSIVMIWHIVPTSLVIFTLTLFVSVTVRSSRTAAGIASAVVIGSYFLQAIAELTNEQFFVTLQKLSLFNYYRAIEAGAQGLQWQSDTLMLGTAAILFVMALLGFQRRDLGV